MDQSRDEVRVAKSSISGVGVALQFCVQNSCLIITGGLALLCLALIYVTYCFHEPEFHYVPANASPVYVAALFHNSEAILDDFVPNILKLAEVVGYSNMYISILEGGSRDSSVAILASLQRACQSRGIAITIKHEDDGRKEGEDRVTFLARKRNDVLYPLKAIAASHSSHPSTKDLNLPRPKLIFFNDVLWNVPSVLRLLSTNSGNFSFACGLDFTHTFYDRWVTRDSYGHVLNPLYPYAPTAADREAVWHSQAFPVHSCWNGIIAFDAELLLHPRFNLRFRGSLSEYEDCVVGSESYFICADIQRVMERGDAPFRPGFINPAVKVFYAHRYEWEHSLLWPLLQPWLWLLAPKALPPVQQSKIPCGLGEANEQVYLTDKAIR